MCECRDLDLLRNELHTMIDSDESNLCEGEILRKSQELDMLIFKYYESKDFNL